MNDRRWPDYPADNVCGHPCVDYFELGSCKCTGYESVWRDDPDDDDPDDDWGGDLDLEDWGDDDDFDREVEPMQEQEQSQ